MIGRILPLLALILILTGFYTAHAHIMGREETMDALAAFFGVPRSAIQIECPQHSFTLTHHSKNPELSLCLHKAEQKKRCEIVIKTLKKAPYINHIAFEAKTSHNINHPTEWVGLMQIHAFPDKNENWRCPPFSLETVHNRLRMYNRWDTEKISRISRHSCAGRGNSIQARTVFENLPVHQNTWFSMDMEMRLSHGPDGTIRITPPGSTPIALKGPNIYNDSKPPYLKFGVYKPTSWGKGHLLSCVTYRNMDIGAKKE